MNFENYFLELLFNFRDKYLVFSLIYKFIELTLILLISTASVERVFSTINIIKSKLRNKIIRTFTTRRLGMRICRLRLKLCPDSQMFLAPPLAAGHSPVHYNNLFSFRNAPGNMPQDSNNDYITLPQTFEDGS
jgi:hypothetical protein